MRDKHVRRGGFTLIEVLIMIAIVVIILGISLSAVQAVRESAARARCMSNMRQLGIATHNFYTTNRILPTYNGIFPLVGGSTQQSANPNGVFGGWFAHLLPYVEQQPLYERVAADVAKSGNGNGMAPATGTLVSPAVPARWDYSNAKLVSPAIPATYNQWTASRQLVSVPIGAANGYSINQSEWQPAQFPDPGTGVGAVYDPPPVYVPGAAAVYDPPGSGPGYVGLWNADVRATTFKMLLCPSDPSVNSSGQVNAGQVYVGDSHGPWGSTNYVANWNTFTNGSTTLGVWAPPRALYDITDGTANTIMFGESYAWCDELGRTALQPWLTNPNVSPSGVTGTNNFGLTYSLTTKTVSAGSATSTSLANGYPNPSASSGLIFPPQIKPLPKPHASCPAGQDCCNNLSVQTGHRTLNVVMADGSVRTVSSAVSIDTWRALLIPDDSLLPGKDW